MATAPKDVNGGSKPPIASPDNASKRMLSPTPTIKVFDRAKFEADLVALQQSAPAVPAVDVAFDNLTYTVQVPIRGVRS